MCVAQYVFGGMGEILFFWTEKRGFGGDLLLLGDLGVILGGILISPRWGCGNGELWFLGEGLELEH